MAAARGGAGRAAQVSLAEVAETAAPPSSSPVVGLQVSIGAIIAKKACVEWSISPFVVTELMPRYSDNKSLRIGDRILSIDGQSVTHMTTVNPLSDLLMGPPCSCVRVVVDRVICEADPISLSVARCTVQKHFESRFFGENEVIFEGWIAKDGRFSSSFKRRWARLSWFHPQYSSYEKIHFPLGFCFSWGESGPDGFVEKNSASFHVPHDAVSVTPLDQPLPGKQLPELCSDFGFQLKIRGRAINIFCDSKSDRDVWMCVFNMANRSQSPRIGCLGDSLFDIDATLKPGSFAIAGHYKPPWILCDPQIEQAMADFTRKKSAKLQLEQKQKQERFNELERKKALERQELTQKIQIAAARSREENGRLDMQRHIDLMFSSNYFHSVDIEGIMQAHCQQVDAFEVLATLMQATVTRVQALDRQNVLLQAQNAALHAENRAQNAVIDQLIGHINQQPLHSTSSSIAATVKQSQQQLHDAALLSDQYFSADASLPPAAAAAAATTAAAPRAEAERQRKADEERKIAAAAADSSLPPSFNPSNTTGDGLTAKELAEVLAPQVIIQRVCGYV